jgi:hypothetical protein
LAANKKAHLNLEGHLGALKQSKTDNEIMELDSQVVDR